MQRKKELKPMREIHLDISLFIIRQTHFFPKRTGRLRLSKSVFMLLLEAEYP